MKKIAALTLLGISIVVSPVTSQAHHLAHPQVAHSILNEVAVVRHDAAIYQRKRVAGEVMRIESDASALDKLISNHACLTADRASLKTAVSALKSAATNSDTDRSIKAVDQIVVIATHISQTSCGDSFD